MSSSLTGEMKKEGDSEKDEDKLPKENKSPLSPKTESQTDSTVNENMKQEVPAGDAALKASQKGVDVVPEKPVGEKEENAVTTTIKEEPMEVTEPPREGSEGAASKPTGPLKTEPAEEARRKTAEEVQRAIKSDQQAKIPLKKREMKLSEDFDSNASSGGSSVIVANTSLTVAKEPAKEMNGDQVNGDVQPAKGNESGTKSSTAAASSSTTTEVKRLKKSQEQNMDVTQMSGKEESTKQQLDKAEDGKKDITAEEKVSTMSPSEEAMEVGKPEASIKSTDTHDDKQKSDKPTREGTSSVEKSSKPSFTTIRKAPSTGEEKSTSSKADSKSSETLDNHGVAPKETNIPNSSKEKADCSKEPNITAVQNDSKKLDGEKDKEKQLPVDQTDKPACFKTTEPVTSSPLNKEKKSSVSTEVDKSKTEKSSLAKRVDEPQVSIEKDKQKVGDNNKQTSAEDVGRASLTEDLSVSEKTTGLSVIRETKSPNLTNKSEDGTTKEGDKPSAIETTKPSVIKEQLMTGTVARGASVTEMASSSSTGGTDRQNASSETSKQSKSSAQEATKSSPSVVKEKSPTSKEVVKHFQTKESIDQQPSLEKKTEKAATLTGKDVTEKEASYKVSETKGTSKETEKETGSTPPVSVADPKDADRLESGKDKTSASVPKELMKETRKAEKETEKQPAKDESSKHGPSVKRKEEPMEVLHTVPEPKKLSSVSEAGRAGERKDKEEKAEDKKSQAEKIKANMDKTEKVEDKNDGAKKTEKMDKAEKVEENKVSKKAEEKRDESKKAEYKKAEDEKAKSKKAEDKAGTKKAEEKKDEFKKAEEKKDESKKVEEKKDESKKAEKKKAESKKAEDKKAESRKAESKKAEDQKAESRKDESRKDESKKAEDKKDESKKVEEKRDESKKAESKKAESKKTAEKKDESKKVKERKDKAEKMDENKASCAETTPMDCDEPAQKDQEKNKSGSEDKPEQDPKQDDDKDDPCKEKKKDDSISSEESKEKDGEKTDEPDKSAAQTEGGEGRENEGLRLKIRMAAHRRKAELQREETRADSESEGGDGRGLRRSPRICRPTAKLVDIQDQKQEKKPSMPLANKENAENEEEIEEECTVPKKPKEKKVDSDGQPKPKVTF